MLKISNTMDDHPSNKSNIPAISLNTANKENRKKE